MTVCVCSCVCVCVLLVVDLRCAWCGGGAVQVNTERMRASEVEQRLEERLAVLRQEHVARIADIQAKTRQLSAEQDRYVGHAPGVDRHHVCSA